MPGSLLLGSTTYSDGSDISGRSLGGKKVSFNKSVRVKQYPWRANSDSELSTLPNDRFWFKVYRNKDQFSNETLRENGNNDEFLNDSLAPISEVDDKIYDDTSLLSRRNGYCENGIRNSQNENHRKYRDQSGNQFIDCFDERNTAINRDPKRGGSITNRIESGANLYRKSDMVLSGNAGQWYDSEFYNDKLKSIDENSSYSCPVSNNRLLPRIDLKSDSSNRRSLRRSNYSQNGIARERRSRSHDDYTNYDNRSECIRKADKSVSTEDLNLNSGRIGLVKKSLSKDAATQYYDNLTRNKTDLKSNNVYSPNSFKTSLYDSVSERLKKFEIPKSRVNPFKESNNGVKPNQKSFPLEKLSNVLPSQAEFKRKNDFSFQELRNKNQYNNDCLSVNDTWSSKPTARAVNGKLNGFQTEINSETYKSIPKIEENQYSRNKWNQNSFDREQNGVGFLAKRHTPLREVNTNTNHDFLCRNTTLKQNATNNSPQNHARSLYTRNYEPTKVGTSEKLQPKRYLSPSNQERRSFKNNSHSSEGYQSPRVEPIIDWSHSGFQLAPKQKYNSASDSECTVNKRPPLLMYIPGVSHHDRPAVEDDRLSHLSDLSRSSLYDGSQLSGFSSRNRNVDDFHLRRSMREGKSKWLNWRKKS